MINQQAYRFITISLCLAGCEIKCTAALIELFVLQAESPEQRQIQVAQRHVVTTRIASIDMSAVLEATAGNKDWQVAIGVRASPASPWRRSPRQYRSR